MQWNLFNADTHGTLSMCPDERGVLIRDCTQSPHYRKCPYFKGVHKGGFQCTWTMRYKNKDALVRGLLQFAMQC